MPLIDSDLPSAKTLPPKKIVFSKTFEKAYKRCKASGRYDLSKVKTALEMLAYRITLPEKYRDHALLGMWSGYRECHLGGDYLLIYKLKGDEIIVAAMLGSHNDCFG